MTFFERRLEALVHLSGWDDPAESGQMTFVVEVRPSEAIGGDSACVVSAVQPDGELVEAERITVRPLDLRELMRARFGRRKRKVIFDLRGVERLDASAIGEALGVWRDVTQAGGAISLLFSKDVLAVLNAAGLRDHEAVFHSFENALRSIS